MVSRLRIGGQRKRSLRGDQGDLRVQVDQLADVDHVEVDADRVGDERELTGVGKDALVDAATDLRVVVGKIGTEVPIVPKVQDRFGITFTVREDEDLFPHGVVGARDTLEDDAVGQDPTVLDDFTIESHVRIPFHVIMDMGNIKQVFEDDVRRDQLVDRLFAAIELRLVVGVLVDQAEDVDQLEFHVLADIAEDIRRPDGVDVRAVDGRHDDVGVDQLRGHVLEADPILEGAEFRIRILGLDTVIDLTQGRADQLEHTIVLAQADGLGDVAHDILRQGLLQSIVDDVVTTNRDFPGLGLVVRTDGHVRFPKVLFRELGVELIRDDFGLDVGHDRSHGRRDSIAIRMIRSRVGTAGATGIRPLQRQIRRRIDHAGDGFPRSEIGKDLGVGAGHGLEALVQQEGLGEVRPTITGVAVVVVHDQAGAVVRRGVELDVLGLAARDEAHDHGLEDRTISDQVRVVGHGKAVDVGQARQVHHVGSLAATDVVVRQQDVVVVVVLQDFDTPQGVGDHGGVAVEMDKGLAMFLGLPFLGGGRHGLVEVIDFGPGDHVVDHGLGRGPTMHHTVDQPTVELEQRDGHGNADVWQDAVGIGTEGFHTRSERSQELGMQRFRDDLMQIQQILLLIRKRIAGSEVSRLRHSAIATVVVEQLAKCRDSHGLDAIIFQIAGIAQHAQAFRAHEGVGERHRAVEGFTGSGDLTKGFSIDQAIRDRAAAVAEVVHVDEVGDVLPDLGDELAFSSRDMATVIFGISHGFTGSQKTLVTSEIT